MRHKFTLWAQALDNTAPDHFDVRGRDLDANETVLRQTAVSNVSNVIKNGRRIYDQDGVLLTVDTSNFVVEVPSVQRDRTGRTAPIVCHGVYDAGAADSDSASAVAALNDFATRIGRTLQPEHLTLVRLSFEVLKKKSPTTRSARAAPIGVVALVLLTIVWWLAKRGW
jgi:hypothetical protein